MPDALTREEQQQLLSIARTAMEAAVRREPIPDITLEQFSNNLQELGVVFVTLTRKNTLRGCIGALDPYQPLALDVQEHAAAAALNDFRFPQVQPDELAEIQIEISRLTEPRELAYTDTVHLLKLLRPGIDGVVVKDGSRRATFLPQVWEKVPNPAHFLSQLCQKMGAPPDLWRRKHLDIYIYQVEEFHE